MQQDVYKRQELAGRGVTVNCVAPGFIETDMTCLLYTSGTAVIATHDMQLVCQWAQRIIVLSGGRVVADGTRDEIFSRSDLKELVGIRPPEIFSMARALDAEALCYTIDEFTECFQEEKEWKN